MVVQQLSNVTRRERRRLETHEKLFRTALALFAERGFASTTIEEITEAADVGKGTFFNYFPTKEHILAALWEVQLAKYERAVAAAQNAGADIRKVLHELYFALPAEGFAHGDKLLRSVLTVFLGNDPLRDRFAARLVQAREMLATAIEIGQEQNVLRRDRAPLELALAFQQSLFGSMLTWSINSDPPAPEPWLETSFEIFWSAVCNQHGASGAAKPSRRRTV